MMTELVLVEGVSDVQLISYYLQNVYGWKHENENRLKLKPLDEHEHIETLSKNGKQLILCAVGGNGKFAYFVDRHRINSIIIDEDIASLMVVIDRDEASDAKVRHVINSSLEKISVNDSLKGGLVPELKQISKANKATVGTFFSVRYPKSAMRKFGVVISRIDWSKSESLRQLFLPFQYLGKEKPVENS